MDKLAEYADTLLGLSLSPEQIDQFQHLTEVLLEWNRRMNLTAIVDPAEIVIKHYLDALTLTTVVPDFDNLQMIDVGTGAGFPGLALAIAFPGLSVTLLDSTAKKLRFITQAGHELALNNIRTVHARAEDAGRHPHHRAVYDLVTARAVARMPALMEYTLPLAKLGGQVIAMAGGNAYEDCNSAAKAIDLLGGELFGIEQINLPTLDNPRYLVVIDKIKPTPERYPRSAGMPTRHPII